VAILLSLHVPFRRHARPRCARLRPDRQDGELRRSAPARLRAYRQNGRTRLLSPRERVLPGWEVQPRPKNEKPPSPSATTAGVTFRVMKPPCGWSPSTATNSVR